MFVETTKFLGSGCTSFGKSLFGLLMFSPHLSTVWIILTYVCQVLCITVWWKELLWSYHTWVPELLLSSYEALDKSLKFSWFLLFNLWNEVFGLHHGGKYLGSSILSTFPPTPITGMTSSHSHCQGARSDTEIRSISSPWTRSSQRSVA